jgi:hypothetical protein
MSEIAEDENKDDFIAEATEMFITGKIYKLPGNDAVSFKR